MRAYFLFAGKDYQWGSPSGFYVGGYDWLEDAQKALPEDQHWAEILEVRDSDYGSAAQLVLTHTWHRDTGVWEKVGEV